MQRRFDNNRHGGGGGGQHNHQKRMRGRNRGGKGPNPLSRSYESNGPDVKIRGTAAHIADKYVQLSRDAQSAGDPVAAQAYMQHAEHYYRLLALAQAQFQPNAVIVRADDEREEYEDDGSDDGGEGHDGNAPEDMDPANVAQPPIPDRDQPREFNGRGRDRFRGRDRNPNREGFAPREAQEDAPAGDGHEPEAAPAPVAEAPARPARGRGRPRAGAVDPAAQPQPRFDSDQPGLPAFITGAPVRAEAASDDDGEEGGARRGRRRRYGRTARPEDGEGGSTSTDEAPVSAD